jgi:ABC-type multidrug transport system fused ATPase/permease subunit
MKSGKLKVFFEKRLFWKLLSLSREEWPILFTGMLFLVISSLSLMAYPQYIKLIIDEALKTQDLSSLNKAALFAVIIFIVQALSSSLRYYFFTLAGEKTVKRLRKKLFSQIIFQELSFFDFNKTGELLGRLSSDTSVLQNALSVNISMLIRNFMQALIGIILLFYTSAKLTIFILVVIPPIAILVAIFGKKVKAFSKKTQDALALSSSIAEETLSGVRTVKAFAQESFEIHRYDNELENSFEINKKKISTIAQFTGLVSILGFSIIVFIVWYGGKLVISNELSIGTLTSYILYVITVAFSFGLLASLYTDFMSAIGAGHRIFELLETSTITTTNNLKTQKIIHTSNIEFKNVSFSYPRRKELSVLSNLTFTIKANETVALVGSSGGGKSTIAQLLLGFYPLNSGEIKISDINLDDFDLYSLRSQIGIVSQEPILISESIADNISYGCPGSQQLQIEEAAKQAYAFDFIKQFPEGFQTLVGEKGVQLSGGQKQRIAIARAILKNPKILILDEATSALDGESESWVQKALEHLQKSRTTIVIAHRLSTVKNADRILVLDGGRIVEEGNHQDLISRENSYYKKIIETHFNKKD